ncbi:hypothetical protein HanXRQr2_Chr04g0145911 [Helianthus annuus]|uniref:Uncharacterized protein n=1 Tax=Helianthus annuus TaxID=4232 RepID=A0A9K3J4V2_HELAN|nr:hypothetical protein HanXRQr2_Chr04g0145911 [Helianthus annuus]KAJ0595556.1 hypothetical protein HanHA89_Chr04g0132631 [Helianthus annuus]KAJ0756211.1 hypothetical protein HanLR1_Chr04g0124451 [Helianthus annuus]KAJ0929727.1 hypothetical protein HanPSC8_Chr04g0140971 [Helianthus annuus]
MLAEFDTFCLTSFASCGGGVGWWWWWWLLKESNGVLSAICYISSIHFITFTPLCFHRIKNHSMKISAHNWVCIGRGLHLVWVVNGCSLNKLLIYPQILKETMSGLDWVVCKDGAAKELTEQHVFLIYYELEICLESGGLSRSSCEPKYDMEFHTEDSPFLPVIR